MPHSFALPPLFRSTRSPSQFILTRTTLSHRTCKCTPISTKLSPSMIQSPSGDGPPNLEEFFDKQRRAIGSKGARVTLGTGRALLANHDEDSAAAALDALAKANESLQRPPQFIHVTISLDVDSAKVFTALREQVDVPLFGRSINKKDSHGTIEVLMLRSDEVGGICVAERRIEGGDGAKALQEAAKGAAEDALARLGGECTFMVFSHSPSGGEAAARKGIEQAKDGIIAYGGSAVGEEATGLGWTLFGMDGVYRGGEGEMVVVAAVPGSLPYLVSAVVKNWAQPAYVEALPYMTPNYIGDSEVDLLTAIRYNDWDKFMECIEQNGVDVNVKWVTKQNQIPLLAACARIRTRMIEYLLAHGADVGHRNDGGFTAVMYTKMSIEYDRAVIMNQLKMLEDAGANIVLTPEEVEKIKMATNGRIVE